MRTLILGVAATALTAMASPALAQDAPQSDYTISGGATVTSDYRFRGISQSDKRFAVQGTIGLSHSSGLYVGTWGSSIDDYVAGGVPLLGGRYSAGADAEIDIYGGFKKTFNGTTVDVGLLYYYYPGSSQSIADYNSDFFEPYASLSHTLGPISAKVGAAYAPKQHAIAFGRNAREDNLYLYGEGSVAVPNTPFTVSAHAGHNSGRSLLTNGLKDYWDWNVGAAYTRNNLTFSVSYVDTDIKDGEFTLNNGRHPAKAGVLGSVAVAF